MGNSSSLTDAAAEFNGTTTQPTEQDAPSHSSVQHTAVSIVYGIIGSVGIVDNLFVILVFVWFTEIINKTMSMLVVHQSIVDTLASFATLITAVVKVDPHPMTRGNVYYEFICRIWMSSAYLFVTSVISTYGIVLMTLDRYIAIIYPIWYKSSVVKKRRLMYSMIVAIWIIIPTRLFSISVSKAKIVNGTCIPFGSHDSYVTARALGLLTVTMDYILPIAVMVFCYARVIYTLKYKVGATSGGSSFSAASRNALVISLLVCCGFLICWTPAQAQYFASFIGYKLDYDAWHYSFFLVLVFANSCVNPLIYAAKYGEFQNGVRRLAAKIRKKPIQPQAQTGQTANTQQAIV